LNKIKAVTPATDEVAVSIAGNPVITEAENCASQALKEQTSTLQEMMTSEGESGSNVTEMDSISSSKEIKAEITSEVGDMDTTACNNEAPLDVEDMDITASDVDLKENSSPSRAEPSSLAW
jgi:hypothetical protein